MLPKVKMVLILLGVLGCTVVSVGALLIATQRIVNVAQMVTIDIGVFWDVTCTQKCDKIDWGTLMPGQNKTVTVYVKNTGGGPITGSFNMSDWVPPLAANYISLTWNFGDKPLDAGRVRKTDFTLIVSRDIHDVTTFYFTITVIGTQYIS
jgi:hypothetical protein